MAAHGAQGFPFENDDAMFNPPAVSGNGRGSYYENIPPSAAVQYESTNDNPITEPKKERSDRDREGRHKDREHREHREHRERDKDRDREHRHKDREHKEKKSSKNRIIPLEEDIRRLFQECKIGLGNASLLSQACVHAKVEELKKGEVIKVCFLLSCNRSHLLMSSSSTGISSEVSFVPGTYRCTDSLGNCRRRALEKGEGAGKGATLRRKQRSESEIQGQKSRPVDFSARRRSWYPSNGLPCRRTDYGRAASCCIARSQWRTTCGTRAVR